MVPDSLLHTTPVVRLIDAGTVSYVRSQSIYHGLAHARNETTPDTLVHAVAVPPAAIDSDSSSDAIDSDSPIAAIPAGGLADAMLTSRMTALLPDSFGPEILGRSLPHS